MSYTSGIYLLFIICTCLVYYVWPQKTRWGVLLAANFVFYMAAGWKEFLFLLAAMGVSYYTCCKMGDLQTELVKTKESKTLDKKQFKEYKEKNKKKSKKYFQIGFFAVLLMLIVVKYTNFLLGNGFSLLRLLGVEMDEFTVKLVVPLGISFYTFQTIAYMLDVYKAKIEPQRNFLKYALYSSFFPSVVQGPIPRYAQLAEQLYTGNKFKFQNIRRGALMILWGFAKKLILSERLSVFINEIYSNYTQYEGVIFAIATAAFSIQIYADFSGCMDIARGTARLFGVELPKNFIQPYFSKTMPEFWRRWHATLGSWFRDYVFFPFSVSKASLKLNKKARDLMGNEVGRIVAATMPILVVWMLTGIWHGSEWKYVAWGLFHGILIMGSTIFTPHFDKLSEKLKIKRDCFSFRFYQMARTFFLCCVGRVFFRADSFGAALVIFKRSLQTTGLYLVMDGKFYTYGLNQANWVVVIIFMVVWLIISKIAEENDVLEVFEKQNVWFRWILVYALFFAVLVFGKYGPGYQVADFIYEQF